jgi:hypothetical protein
VLSPGLPFLPLRKREKPTGHPNRGRYARGIPCRLLRCPRVTPARGCLHPDTPGHVGAALPVIGETTPSCNREVFSHTLTTENEL